MMRGFIGVLALSLVACQSDTGSVVLEFPNEESRAAVRGLGMWLIDTTASAATPPCEDGALLGTAAEGRPPLDGLPGQRFSCADLPEQPCEPSWLERVSISGLAAASYTIYVRAHLEVFGTDDREPPVILEGCTEAFDAGSDDGRSGVPIAMNLVIPDSARLEIVSGQAQVGVPGADAEEPLRARARAAVPGGTTRDVYDLPGVGLEVAIDGDAQLTSGAGPVLTGSDGQAVIPFRYGGPGTSEVRIRAPALEAQGVAFESTTFVSAVAPSFFASVRTVGSVEGQPIDLGVGDVDGDGTDDVVAVGCTGEGVCEVSERLRVEEPQGRASLAVIFDVAGASTLGPVWLGDARIPVGVALSDLAPGGGEEIALAAARDSDCRPTACPDGLPCQCARSSTGGPCSCEASTLDLLRAEPNGWTEVAPRYVTTSSNAVDIAVVDEEDDRRVALLMRGRLEDRRPCRPGPFCDTGCPRGENCVSGGGLNVCNRLDARVELLDLRDQALFEGTRCSCYVFNEPFCPSGFAPPLSSCADAFFAEPERDPDPCRRRLRARIRVSESVPLAFDIGVLRRAGQRDIVVGSAGTMGLVPGDPTWNYARDDALTLTIPGDVTGVRLVDADPRLDARTASDPDQLQGDVWFWSPGPCGSASSCPVERSDAQDRSCLGIWVTAGEPNLYDVDPTDRKFCRRRGLPFAIDEGCIGDFNGDGRLDLAAASSTESSLAVFFGDGFGGLTTSPTLTPLPGGASGGPIACQDIDGDARTDVVVLSVDGGAIHVLLGAG